MQFHKGDIVILKTGTAEQVVLKTNGTELLCRYASDKTAEHYPPRWRPADHFRLLHPANSKFTTTEKVTAPMTKLFQVTAEPESYGTFLTNSSTGQIVLEMKPGGVIKAFDATELTEVRPYTIRMSNNQHFVAIKGSVEVGDMIVTKHGDMLSVTKLDTNSDSTTSLEGRKVLTEAI